MSVSFWESSASRWLGSFWRDSKCCGGRAASHAVPPCGAAAPPLRPPSEVAEAPPLALPRAGSDATANPNGGDDDLKALIGFSRRRLDADEQGSNPSSPSNSLIQAMRNIEKLEGEEKKRLSRRQTLHSRTRSGSFHERDMQSTGSEKAIGGKHASSDLDQEADEVDAKYEQNKGRMQNLVKTSAAKLPPLHLLDDHPQIGKNDKARRQHKKVVQEIGRYQDSVLEQIRKHGNMTEEDGGFAETADPAEAVIAGVLKMHKCNVDMLVGGNGDGDGVATGGSDRNSQKAIRLLDDMPAWHHGHHDGHHDTKHEK